MKSNPQFSTDFRLLSWARLPLVLVGVDHPHDVLPELRGSDDSDRRLYMCRSASDGGGVAPAVNQGTADTFSSCQLFCSMLVIGG